MSVKCSALPPTAAVMEWACGLALPLAAAAVAEVSCANGAAAQPKLASTGRRLLEGLKVLAPLPGPGSEPAVHGSDVG